MILLQDLHITPLAPIDGGNSRCIRRSARGIGRSEVIAALEIGSRLGQKARAEIDDIAHRRLTSCRARSAACCRCPTRLMRPACCVNTSRTGWNSSTRAMIIDLDRPRRGLILVSQQSMINLQESIKHDLP
jgi:hypothetical protein